MTRNEILDILSSIYAPAAVRVGSEYWSFLVEASPATLIHVYEAWAEGADESSLRGLLNQRPAGEFAITGRGDLVAVK